MPQNGVEVNGGMRLSNRLRCWKQPARYRRRFGYLGSDLTLQIKHKNIRAKKPIFRLFNRVGDGKALPIRRPNGWR